MNNIKLCKDCKFYKKYPSLLLRLFVGNYPKCTNIVLSKGSLLDNIEDSYTFCEVNRVFEHSCGTTAKYFEKKI